MVQKALYPEGPNVCHVAILHPPSGIAGGDALAIDIRAEQGAHALLTTPGATRWYKSNSRHASQTVVLHLDAEARLDWLPQENIFFEQAWATSSTQLHLQNGSRAIGWEITQLGSVAALPAWAAGTVHLDTRILLDERLIWLDTGEIHADGPLRTAANGLAGFPAMGTLWAFGPNLGTGHIDSLAQTLPWGDALRAGITCLPQKNEQGLYLVRVLGRHVADIKALLIELWMALRPALLETPGEYLRLWST